jgi:sulfur transfer complex TusBCD TusB component (DsrH family)
MMLIIFLGTGSKAIESLMTHLDDNKVCIIVAQQGVYCLDTLLMMLGERSQLSISVLDRDLKASGLVTKFENDKRLQIIGFNEFVTLSTSYTPCLTIQ